MSMLKRLKGIFGSKKELKEEVNSEITEETSEEISNKPSTQPSEEKISEEIKKEETKPEVPKETKTEQPVKKTKVKPKRKILVPEKTSKSEQKVPSKSSEKKSKVSGPKVVKKEIQTTDENQETETPKEEKIEITDSEPVEEVVEEVSEPEPVEEVVEEVSEPEPVEEVVEEVSEENEEEVEEAPTDADEESKPKLGDKMSLLKKDEVMKSDLKDKEFSELLKVNGSESLEYCFQCGTCTGSCPSGRRTPYKIRQIVRKANIGLKEELLASDELWMCTTCYTCQERCPRGLKIVDIVKAIRNEAAKAGFMAPAHKATGKFVINFGHGVPINDATKDLRKKVGLDEVPPTTHKYPEALDEVQKIVKATGFDALIGFNWEKGDLE